MAAPLALLAFGAVVLWIVPWPCPIRFALGIPCPSCGLTRAVRAAIAFDFHAATHFHPLWFVVLPALSLFAAVELGVYVVRGRPLHLDRNRGVRFAFGAIIVAMIVVWIARFFGAFGGPVEV